MLRSFLLVLLCTGQIHSWAVPFLYERPVPITFVRTSIEQSDDSAPIFHELHGIMNRMQERFERMFGWPSWIQHLHYHEDDNEDENEQTVDEETEGNHVEPHHFDDWIEEEKPLSGMKKQLDAVPPVCTTVVHAPTTISPRKSRRKKQRTTQTKTCVRQLIVNGEKFILEEEITTDDQGVLIKQSKNYSRVSMIGAGNTTTTTTPLPDY